MATLALRLTDIQVAILDAVKDRRTPTPVSELQRLLAPTPIHQAVVELVTGGLLENPRMIGTRGQVIEDRRDGHKVIVTDYGRQTLDAVAEEKVHPDQPAKDHAREAASTKSAMQRDALERFETDGDLGKLTKPMLIYLCLRHDLEADENDTKPAMIERLESLRVARRERERAIRGERAAVD